MRTSVRYRSTQRRGSHLWTMAPSTISHTCQFCEAKLLIRHALGRAWRHLFYALIGGCYIFTYVYAIYGANGSG